MKYQSDGLNELMKIYAENRFESELLLLQQSASTILPYLQIMVGVGINLAVFRIIKSMTKLETSRNKMSRKYLLSDNQSFQIVNMIYKKRHDEYTEDDLETLGEIRTILTDNNKMKEFLESVREEMNELRDEKTSNIIKKMLKRYGPKIFSGFNGFETTLSNLKFIREFMLKK